MHTTPILAIDGGGLLNAFSRGADLTWSGPQLVGPPAFAPGADTVVRAIGPDLFTALVVDRAGVLNAFFLDEAVQNSWLGPSLVGDANLAPSASVAIATADGRQFWALAIDRSGLLKVFFLDAAAGRAWTAATALRDADLVPGARVTIVGDATATLAALAVDREGAIQIYAFDASAAASWSGPLRLIGAGLVAGAWIGA